MFNSRPDRIFMFCSGHNNLHECGQFLNKLDLIRFGLLPSEYKGRRAEKCCESMQREGLNNDRFSGSVIFMS